MRHTIGSMIAVSAFAIPGAACAYLFLRDVYCDWDARRRIAALVERERATQW